MGIREKIALFYRAANEAFGRHGILFAIFFWFVVPAAVSGAMIWLAFQLSWFWETFQLFGVAAVGLITWALVGLGLAAYRTAGKPKLKRKAAAGAINWDVVKRRPSLTMREAARVLDGVAPTDIQLSPNGTNIQRLMFDCIKDGTLEYIKVMDSRRVDDVEIPPNFDTKLTRENILKFAAQNGINVSHYI